MRGYQTFAPSSDVEAPDEAKRSPMAAASCASRLLLAFVSPLMRAGSARPLESRDFWPLDAQNGTESVTRSFKSALQRSSNSLPRAIARCFAPAMLVGALATLLTVGCSVLAPLVLHHVVDAMAEPAEDMERDLAAWLLAFFAAKLTNALVSAQANLYLQVVSNRAYIALRAVLFDKALRRAARGKGAASDRKDEEQDKQEKQEAAAVDLANLYSTDVGNVLYTVYQANNLWILPLQIGVVVYLLYAILGAAAFAGLGVIVLTMVLSFVIALMIGGVFEQIMARKDARMKAIKEVFGAIQIVKLNAWEDKFAERIRDLRDKELDSIGRFAYTISATVFLLWASPILVSAVSFAVYALVMGQQLTAAKVFTSIALFNAIREPLRQLPTVLQMTIQAIVSLGRINEFLAMEEYDPNNVTNVPSDENSPLLPPGVAVSIRDASFGWSNDSATLKNANLEVLKGDLVVVDGAVGSGKSTLCMSLLGETHKLSGEVTIRGSVAFYSQQTWIQNLTVRENIVFGLPFDQAKYQQVIEACGLVPDLQQLTAGDSTEIGQKGVNLSGGQKARVCLARACYADADVYILDSPLAAVDAVVQKEIFNKCICGLLATKTIVLVTHNPEVIGSSAANCKVHIANDGEEVSVTRQIVKNPRKEYAVADATQDAADSDANNGKGSENSGKLTVEEEREVGRVSKSVYWAYFKAIGGVQVCAILLLVQLMWQIFQISSDLWLSHWTGQRAGALSDENVDVEYNITVYSLLGAGAAFMVLLRVVAISFVGLKASRTIFESMTRSLLHAPLRFFDTNPIGRIVNRYGDDLMALDLSVQFAFGSFLAYIFFTTCQLATAVYMVSFLGLLIIPLIYMYATVANYYLASSREIARHFRVAESPLLSHVTQSEEGVVVLRAFGDRAVQNAVSENVALIDAVTRVWIVKAATDQWFALRIELVGCGVVTLIVSSLIYLRAVLSPGLVGLAFTYALSVDGGLAGLVQLWSWLEIEMVSPERLLEYTAIPSEGGQKIASIVEPPGEWPSRGSIGFSKVAYRYDDAGGPLVLKDVSFSISSKEKIGIVGRTGAGKSSLTMALFRINELAAGTIFIDDVDVSTISLHALRSHMTIIPQSPVLFKGTLRAYMDPFDEFSDADIWSSLERVDMKQQVSELDGKLSHELSENGENFSVGERQLLCMARALLTKSRIVVMDEATASIDHGTEKKLQEMIDRDFQDATVLTIAHRLSTVLDSDRIMVLSDGKVVEFGPPKELVKREGGVFHQLASEGGYLSQLL